MADLDVVYSLVFKNPEQIMDELLANPAFQAAIAPFFAALVAGFLLKYAGWYWAGLAVMLGFYASVSLVTGFELTPLTSTRKVVVLGMIAVAAGLLLDLFNLKRQYLLPLLASAGTAALLWVIWPPLMRMEGQSFWLYAAGGSAYVIWLMLSLESLRSRALRADAAAMTLSLGTGIAALIGASALLGQLGSALAAALGAFLLLSVMKKTLPVGFVMILPVTLLSGLIGMSGLVYAKLPWYSLPSLALIPLLARIPLPKRLPLWGQALALLAATAPAAMGAIYMAWRIAGAPPM